MILYAKMLFQNGCLFRRLAYSRGRAGNAALTWQVIANKSDLADFRRFFHEVFLPVSAHSALINRPLWVVPSVAPQRGNAAGPVGFEAPGSSKAGQGTVP